MSSICLQSERAQGKQEAKECMTLQVEMLGGQTEGGPLILQCLVISFLFNTFCPISHLFLGCLSLNEYSFPQQIAVHHGNLDVGVCCSRWGTSSWLNRFSLILTTTVSCRSVKGSFCPHLSPAISNLLFPALSLLAVGGIMLLITNMQVGADALTLTCPLNLGFSWWIFSFFSNDFKVSLFTQNEDLPFWQKMTWS